jgi:hypothetical protein
MAVQLALRLSALDCLLMSLIVPLNGQASINNEHAISVHHPPGIPASAVSPGAYAEELAGLSAHRARDEHPQWA